MNYSLNDISATQKPASTLQGLGKLFQMIQHERRNLLFAFAAIFINSILNLLGPFIIGRTIDQFLVHPNYAGVVRNSAILLGMYMLAFVASFLQTRLMGGVGQRMLFVLRNRLFGKIQELPTTFFNQNKAGDLISRVNSDTDKINQFFSQSLMQFIGTLVTMTGAGIFLLIINPRLGLAVLVPGLLIFIFTRMISPWIKKKNALSLKTTGALSAEIQESLNNYKVIIAFNRRDYFRKRFEDANSHNYKASLTASVANTLLIPVYGFMSNLAQLVVLIYGIYLIAHGLFSVGLLVSYLAYATNFYSPLRQLAALWTSFQVAMAGWDRISIILNLESDLSHVPDAGMKGQGLLEFRDIHFAYPGGKEILHRINFVLNRGKTYALVGPTGGGKTTTASLIARLFDPVEGTVYLHGRDIRSFSSQERTEKIGFILQEPFLFTGTVKENIIYGNEKYRGFSNEEMKAVLSMAGLDGLLSLFEQGLDTKIVSGFDSISLGQKQLIAFMRAIIRNPELIILDEATANIDTVTEKILQDILNKLPSQTTRVIIAHRLNTIQNADEIFFVNAGELIRAGSFDHALRMLLEGKRES